MKMMRVRQIDADETNIPAGWPRPYYEVEDTSGKTMRQYTQWSSARGAAQIMECEDDRTWKAGVHHLCSSCGVQMVRGLIFDREAVKKGAPGAKSQWQSVGREDVDVVEIDMLDKYDTHYGSPICFRCAVFAAKHCPFLGAIHDPFGDDFPWIITSGPQDYSEFDETSGLEVIDASALERITTGQVILPALTDGASESQQHCLPRWGRGL